MNSSLIQKLIENAGAGHIAEALSEMSGTDLHTLLMQVFALRVQELVPSIIDSTYRKNRLVPPCTIDQHTLIKADSIAYRILDTRFKGIELSPVMPLGTNSVLGGVNQKNVLGAIRSCEVLADPTTALALECARWRKTALDTNSRNDEMIRLATSARCIRLQRFDDIPGFVPHFRIFALATAGRDTGSEQFEISALMEHVRFYLDYLVATQSIGCTIRNVYVDLSDVRIMRAVIAHHSFDSAEIGRRVQARDSSVFTRYEIKWPQRIRGIEELSPEFIETYNIEKEISLLSKLEEYVLEPLRKDYPSVTFSIDLDRAAGVNYYTNACVKIWAVNDHGEKYPLIDGGFTDWTQKLLQSRKERMFASGMGTELILSNFRSTISTSR